MLLVSKNKYIDFTLVLRFGVPFGMLLIVEDPAKPMHLPASGQPMQTLQLNTRLSNKSWVQCSFISLPSYLMDLAAW